MDAIASTENKRIPLFKKNGFLHNKRFLTYLMAGALVQIPFLLVAFLFAKWAFPESPNRVYGVSNLPEFLCTQGGIVRAILYIICEKNSYILMTRDDLAISISIITAVSIYFAWRSYTFRCIHLRIVLAILAMQILNSAPVIFVFTLLHAMSGFAN